jgi:hypothetical protein
MKLCLGDHLTLLNVLNAYRQVNGDSRWCREHFIHARAMRQVLVTINIAKYDTIDLSNIRMYDVN